MSRRTARLYKFYGPGHVLENLRRNRLKLSTIDDLNDPFEFNPFYIESPKARETWRLKRQEVFRRIGLICFSRSWSNPLMWSHYADGHNGLCLEMEVNLDSTTEVSYQEERKPFPNVRSKPIHESFSDIMDIFSVKYSHWSYELETRKFFNLEDCETDGILSFAPLNEDLSLKRIFIGPRSKITSDEIRDAIGQDSRIEIVTTRMAFKTYEVVRQKRPDLQS